MADKRPCPPNVFEFTGRTIRVHLHILRIILLYFAAFPNNPAQATGKAPVPDRRTRNRGGT